MTLVIEKNIPIPEDLLDGREKRLVKMSKMAVGDSFAVAPEEIVKVRADVYEFHRPDKPRAGRKMKFSVSSVHGRCWRVA